MYERKHVKLVVERLSKPRKKIQVIMGPRQVGKTTVVKQVIEKCPQYTFHYFSADNVVQEGNRWIVEKWETVRQISRLTPDKENVLIIDEIQKISNWSEAVKAEWDHDTFNNSTIKVILLGSSRLKLQKGLNDSLCGRFDITEMSMWAYPEMREAFRMTIDEYVFFGGFPGLADEIKNEFDWRNAIGNSIINPMLETDIHQIEEIRNPALMRNVFILGSIYSSQELSISKMQNQINNGSNPTIANYLQILDNATMLKTLPKYSSNPLQTKSSIPKLQVYNNGFKSYCSGDSFEEVRKDPTKWGRYIESAVGAYLACESASRGIDVLFWRDKIKMQSGVTKVAEIDFILKKGTKMAAIEVKSSRSEETIGQAAIKWRIPEITTSVTIGPEAIPLETFLALDIEDIFKLKS